MTSRATPEQLELAQQLIDKPRKPILNDRTVKIPAGSNPMALRDAMLASGRFSVNEIKRVTALPPRERERVRKSLVAQGFASDEKPNPKLDSSQTLEKAIVDAVNADCAKKGQPAKFVQRTSEDVTRQQIEQYDAAREIVREKYGV